MIVKNTYDETKSSQGIYRVEWTKVAGDVKTMEGYFLVEPFGNTGDRTLLTYEVRSNPGSRVPRFLLKWGVKKAMPASIRATRRQATKQFGRPPPL